MTAHRRLGRLMAPLMEPGRRTGVHLRSKSWEGVLGAGDRRRLAKNQNNAGMKDRNMRAGPSPALFFSTATAAASA
jgi:hypothetical protein